MAYQSGKNVVVGYKVESAFNTAPGTGSATQLRLNDGAGGMGLTRALIPSNEIRSDGLQLMPRLGSREARGTYNCPLAVGAHDTWLEAILRSTWAAAVAITNATMTSITTPTTSTIVAAAGSWLTQGVRVGDVVTLTGHATVANNNLRLRVKAVTASTITVHGTPLTVDAVADATFTLTILKKLKNATTPTKRSFYIDEFRQDIDTSHAFGGCKIIGMKIVGQPDGSASIEFTVLGASQAVLSGASAPYFIAPTLSVSPRLVFTDAVLSWNGSDIAVVTAFELNYQINASAQPVIGSTITPDIFDNDAVLSGSISFISQDGTNVTAFLNETEVEFHALLLEPEADPKDCLSVFVPRVKAASVGDDLGGDGAMIEQVNFVTGKKESTTSYDDTVLTLCTSAP